MYKYLQMKICPSIESITYQAETYRILES